MGGEGSKAVWNSSENSSVLEAPPVRLFAYVTDPKGLCVCAHMWRPHMWPPKQLSCSPEARTVPELEAPGSGRSGAGVMVVLDDGAVERGAESATACCELACPRGSSCCMWARSIISLRVAVKTTSSSNFDC